LIRFGRQGDGWNRGDVFLGHDENFMVGFAAKKGYTNQGEGDIAVDDIEFTDCEPPIIDGENEIA
jgi:hypothetical protein